MNILFEELIPAQRLGGVESATRGLVSAFSAFDLSVGRRDSMTALPERWIPDLVHLHGIWSPALARRWWHWHKLGKPCLVTLHGMLEPWALAHKKWKKQVAWHTYQKHILNCAGMLHATSEREAANLRALGLRPPIATIPWGVKVEGGRDQGAGGRGRRPKDDCSGVSTTVADFSSSIPDPQSPIPNPPRTALFVGRLYPVKGLPMLLEAWARVRPNGWRLRLVGPDEAGHEEELKRLCERLGLEWMEGRAGSTHLANLSPTAREEEEPACGGPPAADEVGRLLKGGPTVIFSGPLAGEALANAYRDADLFILPSHTENFGMAIGEAMAHGLPVFTTHGAPWKLLEEEQCGWWVPVSVDGIAAALDDATRRSPEELAAMGERGRAVVVERFSWDKIAADMVACYEWLLGRGAKPDCVRQC